MRGFAGLGAVPRGKQADFYRTADVLIFPTLSMVLV